MPRASCPKRRKFGSEKLVIKQDGPNLEFDYDSDGKRSVAVYVSDKKDKVLREVPAAGSAIVTMAYWKGASLIIQTKAVFKMSFAAEMMNTKDTWTLSEDGLVLANKDASDDGSFMKVYDKRN